MTTVYTGATDPVRQIIHHHALLRRGLERRVGTLCEAVESGIPSGQQRRTLRDYLARQILPHAEAEERTLYHAAATQARGSDLVRILTAEHRELDYLAGRLRDGTNAAETARVSEWIATLFAGHAARENDLLLPALTGAGVDLTVLLADMHSPHASAHHAAAAVG